MGNSISGENIEDICAEPNYCCDPIDSVTKCSKTHCAENNCKNIADSSNNLDKTANSENNCKMAVKESNDEYRPDFWTNCRCFFESHDPGRVLAKERMMRRKRESSVRSSLEGEIEDVGSNGDSPTCQIPSELHIPVGLLDDANQKPTEDVCRNTASTATISCATQCCIADENTETPSPVCDNIACDNTASDDTACDDTTGKNKSKRVSWKIKKYKGSKSKKPKKPTETEEEKETCSTSTPADLLPKLVCSRLATCPKDDDVYQTEDVPLAEPGPDKKTRWKKWKTSMDNPISVIHEETFGPGPEEVVECQPICQAPDDLYPLDDNGLNVCSNENETNIPEGSDLTPCVKRARRKLWKLSDKNSERKPKKRHFWGKSDKNMGESERESTPSGNNSLDEIAEPIAEDNSEENHSVKRNRRKRRNRMSEVSERKQNKTSFWKKNFLSCTKKDDCSSDMCEPSSSNGATNDGGHTSIVVTCKPMRLLPGDSEISLSQSLEPNNPRDASIIEGY